MKKVATKPRPLTKPLHPQIVQKPYGFCCEEKFQDPEKHYDMRNPPFASSLTHVTLDGGGPGAKFRMEETVRPLYSTQRRILEIKGVAYLGFCKRSRGPLRWCVEDEIALARRVLAEKKRNDYNASVKKNLKIAKQRAKKRRSQVKQNFKRTKL